MLGLYLYLLFMAILFVFLGYKIIVRKRHKRQAYEEREENVFYDTVKDIRRD